MSRRWKLLGVMTVLSLGLCGHTINGAMQVDCDNATTSKVLFDLSTGAWSCGTDTGGSDSWTRTVLTADSASSDAANYTALSNLNFAISASTNYRVRCEMWVESTSSTVALQLQVTGPASPTEVHYWRTFSASATASVNHVVDEAFHTTTTDDAATSSDSSTNVASADQVSMVIFNGANAGTVAFAYQSETGGTTVTIHAGSWCEYMAF